MSLAKLQGGERTANAMTEPVPCPVDFEQILQVTDGDEEFVQDLVEIYVDDTPNQLESLLAGITEGDNHAIEEAAHKMKGSSSNMGFWKVELLSFLLLMMARDNDVQEGDLILERIRYENSEALKALDYAMKNGQFVGAGNFFKDTVRATATALSQGSVAMRQAITTWNLPALAQEATALEQKAAGGAFWVAERAACGLRYAAEAGDGTYFETWLAQYDQGVAKVLAYLDVRR
ncbi:MAG: Hpt domain-containing protein [Bradymonadia bacterium]